jgi:hypothetical protein
MKISTKSFTYKLVQQYSGSRPSNDLCSYFWQALWCWMKGAALWWAIASFVFLELLTITLFFVEGLNIGTVLTANDFFCDMLLQSDSLSLNIIGLILWSSAFIVFFVGNILGMSFLVACIIYVISKLLPEKNQQQEESNSVVKEYYKSLKGKYCTKIDFVDE